MTIPGSLWNAKVLRPEQCEVLDGKPCAACAEDIELEKEIRELERSIEELQSRHCALRTVMNENHDHLIQKFPPEIASHIFIQYAPPSVSRYKEERSTPLRLGAVCRKWRQLAWATPQLWSSLVVEVTALGEHPLQLIAEWLERSGCLPLTIRFDHSDKGQVRVYPELTKILNKHSARWYDMYLEMPVDHLHHLSGSSQGNILRRLTLRHPISNPARSKISTFSMTTKPHLTDLTLLSVGLPCVDITWNNLTVASLYDIDVEECLELIRQAPFLQILRLQLINTSSGVFLVPNFTRIVHPHLRSLELRQIEKTISYFRILDSLCLPSLEQWLYDFCPVYLEETMIPFMGHLSSLKIFKINIDHYLCCQVIRMLSHLSSLESLELRSVYASYVIKELLDLLFNPAQSPLFLPRLQSLELVYGLPFPWESLPRIFASSRGQSLRVKVYTQPDCHDTVDKTAKLILELVDKGFDLSVDAFYKYEEWNC